MRKIGVLSSGGDTPGMNAAVRAVVKTAAHYDLDVMGIRYGYKGLMDGDLFELDPDIVRTIAHKGGTILKTARSKEFMTEEGMRKALNDVDAYDLDGIVCIGGDGTMKGAADLTRNGVSTICLPGTIDNDLAYTDFTIGFDTAINGVITEMIKVRDTMISHDRIGVVEVMGNKCGDIALHAGLASSCDYIIVPEIECDLNDMCRQLEKARLRGKMTCMIIVAEGVTKGESVAQYIRDKTGFEAKSSVLGYTQRGGSPTASDRILASRLGQAAVDLLYYGKSNRAVGIRNEEIVDMDIQEALESVKLFDAKLYNLANILVE
jgi:6-phosphofructokinase 1